MRTTAQVELALAMLSVSNLIEALANSVPALHEFMNPESHGALHRTPAGEKPALAIYLDWTGESFPDWKGTAFLVRRGESTNEVFHITPGHSYTLSTWESKIQTYAREKAVAIKTLKCSSSLELLSEPHYGSPEWKLSPLLGAIQLPGTPLIISVSGAYGDNLIDLALAYSVGAGILVQAGTRLDSLRGL